MDVFDNMPSHKIDRFLQFYVLGANNSDEPSIDVTLSLQGMVVSGTIIGAGLYAKLQAASADAPGTAKIFADLIAESAEEQIYIHLQDAVLMMGTQMVPSKGSMLWRGRLDAVNGFFFGRIGFS